MGWVSRLAHGSEFYGAYSRLCDLPALENSGNCYGGEDTVFEFTCCRLFIIPDVVQLGWPLWFWSLHLWPFMPLVAGRLLVGGAAKVFWLRNVSKFRQNLTRFVKASLKIALSVRAAILVSNFPSLAWGWVSNLLRRRRRRRQGGEKPRWPPVMSRRSYGK